MLIDGERRGMALCLAGLLCQLYGCGWSIAVTLSTHEGDRFYYHSRMEFNIIIMIRSRALVLLLVHLAVIVSYCVQC